MQGKSEGSTLEFTLVDPSGAKHPIRLSPADSPIDLKAYMSDYAPLSHYTNYHFEAEGKVFQDYIELSEQGLGETLAMVLNPYNDRSFRQHLKRVKEILVHPPSAFSNVIVTAKEQSLELDETVEKTIPNFDIESLMLQPKKVLCNMSGLNPYSNEEEVLEVPSCVSGLALSEFNPPSGRRKVLGDLGYVVARTLEGSTVHITCAVNGFYVNSTDSVKGVLKPEPTTEIVTGKTLVELLIKVSPGFKTNWNKLITIGKEWNTIRNLSMITPTPSWIVEKPEEIFEPENVAMRDWNEEFQMVRSLPTETPLQRIQRDKALGKIYSDFLEVAISGAKNVINGSVQPLNPMDPPKQQLFVMNHIFFSFTEDLGYIVNFI